MAAKWFALDASASGGRSNYSKSYSRLCLKGSYHVLDEAAHMLSDFQLTTVLVHVLYPVLAWYLDLILPIEFFYVLLIKVRYYRFRQGY
ncbi:hypothetical protein NL676_026015 [Syzygium grande]|nr:hypothetical protein NL676_026015 [Syzygium grande]